MRQLYNNIPAELKRIKLPGKADSLYSDIVQLAKKEGYCYASNEYFANLYGVSVRTIVRWVRRLEDLGFIDCETVTDDQRKGGRFRMITVNDIQEVASNLDQDNEPEALEIISVELSPTLKTLTNLMQNSLVYAQNKAPEKANESGLTGHDKKLNVMTPCQGCHDGIDKSVMTPHDKNVMTHIYTNTTYTNTRINTQYNSREFTNSESIDGAENSNAQALSHFDNYDPSFRADSDDLKKPKTASEEPTSSGRGSSALDEDGCIDVKEGTNLYQKFVQFWEAYPRKVNFYGACNAWGRIDSDYREIDDEFFQEIMQSLERWKKTSQWQDRKYIKYPRNWLQEKCFLDEILDEDLAENDPELQKEKRKSQKHTLNKDYGEGDDFASPNPNPIQSKQKERAVELEKDFEVFWKNYPKKKAKQNALKAWKKLKPDKELQAKMMKAVDLQKKTRQWKSENGRYIPYGATWINGKRWDDEVDVPETSSEKEYSDGVLEDPEWQKILGGKK